MPLSLGETVLGVDAIWDLTGYLGATFGPTIAELGVYEPIRCENPVDSEKC